MTVYSGASPQVLAATIPAGLVSTQIGTLVKLVRVMMLGPVVACVAVFARDLRSRESPKGAENIGIFQVLLPWFIAGFFLLATFRSLSLVPNAAIFPLQKAATILTILSMAALRTSVVDLKVVGRIGAER